WIPGAERELWVPPAETGSGAARMSATRRHSPSTIPRAGGRPLDPAARGEPLAWPAPGVLVSGFGERDRDHHEGIDLACPEGTPVRAADDGDGRPFGARQVDAFVVLAEESRWRVPMGGPYARQL